MLTCPVIKNLQELGMKKAWIKIYFMISVHHLVHCLFGSMTALSETLETVAVIPYFIYSVIFETSRCTKHMIYNGTWQPLRNKSRYNPWAFVTTFWTSTCHLNCILKPKQNIIGSLLLLLSRSKLKKNLTAVSFHACIARNRMEEII